MSFISDFPEATYAQWRKLVESNVQGTKVDCGLGSYADDDIQIEPIYAKAVNRPNLALRAGSPSWILAQRVDSPDIFQANEFAQVDLENGANGLVLVGPGSSVARGFGLQDLSATVLNQVLHDISLDLISVRVDAGQAAAPAAENLSKLMVRRGLRQNALNIDFGIDPIGNLARGGSTLFDSGALDIAAKLLSAWDGSRPLIADGRPYHEAGASQAQELACVIATALFYLRELEKRGLALSAARCGISFLLTADTDIFLTLAKLRTLRLLWARIEDACELQPLPIYLHAETSWRMLSTCDPHLNIVRGTIATFAAGLGGADAITILPFTQGVGLPDSFARRLARNTKTILQAEAGLSRVADPAAGSGAFEGLSRALAKNAWQIFQMIERNGGMVAALSNNEIQRAICAVREKRQHKIRRGERIIVGTTKFSSSAELSVNVLRSMPSDCADQALMKSLTALPCRRDSQPFEAATTSLRI